MLRPGHGLPPFRGVGCILATGCRGGKGLWRLTLGLNLRRPRRRAGGRHGRCTVTGLEAHIMTTERTAERKALAKFIEEAIEKGASTVEDVHKSIWDLPLKMLEESDLLRGPAKEVRRVQDHTIGAIYDLIRHINQQVGTLASELLDKAAQRRSARGEAAAKHPRVLNLAGRVSRRSGNGAPEDFLQPSGNLTADAGRPGLPRASPRVGSSRRWTESRLVVAISSSPDRGPRRWRRFCCLDPAVEGERHEGFDALATRDYQRSRRGPLRGRAGPRRPARPWHGRQLGDLETRHAGLDDTLYGRRSGPARPRRARGGPAASTRSAPTPTSCGTC